MRVSGGRWVLVGKAIFCAVDSIAAMATGKSISLIYDRGFGIADPLDVNYDSEPPPVAGVRLG